MININLQSSYYVPPLENEVLNIVSFAENII